MTCEPSSEVPVASMLANQSSKVKLQDAGSLKGKGLFSLKKFTKGLSVFEYFAGKKCWQ